MSHHISRQEIKDVADQASEAFFRVVAEHFDSLGYSSGDFDPIASEQFEQAAAEAVDRWEQSNRPISDEQARKNYVENIRHLFPPDNHSDGRDLLIQALCETWRELPTPVLARLSALNIQLENRQAQRSR